MMQDDFNRPNTKIDLLILESNYTEGITLKNITHIHIYDIPDTYKTYHQVVRRGVRLCKHDNKEYKSFVEDNKGVSVTIYELTCFGIPLRYRQIMEIDQQRDQYNRLAGKEQLILKKEAACECCEDKLITDTSDQPTSKYKAYGDYLRNQQLKVCATPTTTACDKQKCTETQMLRIEALKDYYDEYTKNLANKDNLRTKVDNHKIHILSKP